MAEWLRALIFHYCAEPFDHPTTVFGVGSSPTRGTCETSQVLLACARWFFCGGGGGGGGGGMFSHFRPWEVVCPCHGAIYMYMTIIYHNRG